MNEERRRKMREMTYEEMGTNFCEDGNMRHKDVKMKMGGPSLRMVEMFEGGTEDGIGTGGELELES